VVWVRSLGVSRHELELPAEQKSEKVHFLVNINGDHSNDVNILGLVTHKHK